MRSYFIPSNSIPAGYDMRYVVTDSVLATVRLVNDNDEFIMYIFDDLLVGQNIYLRKRIGGISLSVDSDYHGSGSLGEAIKAEIANFERRKVRRAEADRREAERRVSRDETAAELSFQEYVEQYSHLPDNETTQRILQNAYLEYQRIHRSINQVPTFNSDFFERVSPTYRTVIPYESSDFRLEDLVSPEGEQ